MRSDRGRNDLQHDGAGRRGIDHAFFLGLARAFGGAIFFSLPLLMTMEMWWLGFYMDRLRLAIFMLLFFPMLVGLSLVSGFKRTRSVWEDVEDATVAYLVGFVTAAVVLALMRQLDTSMPLRDAVGRVALQAVPASVGAVLAHGLLGGPEDRAEEEEKMRQAGYGGEMFLMAAGAVFLAFNVAPTEEMILIAAAITPWHALALMAASLLMMHAFVYAVEFRGQARQPAGGAAHSAFLHYTLTGYAVALLLSAYVLWTFGRFEGTGVVFQVQTTIVLGLPASLGAAAARLVL